MELYLSSTVRLWSCEPIILALPLNRWWSPPSPRLQPARELGEPDETDLGNALDYTRVRVCTVCRRRMMISVVEHHLLEELCICGKALQSYLLLSPTLSACFSVAVCHPLPLFLIASVPFIRGGLWETACLYCARDAAHQFGSCHPAAQSIRHWQRAAVQLPFCELLTLHPWGGWDMFTHCERNCTLHFN